MFNRPRKVMESDICLLCLEHKERLKVPRKVFETTVINTIIRHFWFAPEDAEKHSVCNDCWQQVNEFDKFYKTVEMLHEYRVSSIKVSAECAKPSFSVLEPEVGRCTSWYKEFHTEQSPDKISVFDAVLVEEEESQIDQFDDPGDMGLNQPLDNTTDTKKTNGTLGSNFDVVQSKEKQEQELQIDQLDDEDDLDFEDKADDSTSIEVHENAWLKISVLNVPTNSLYEEDSHSEHSVCLTDADSKTSDSDSEKILNKYDEPATEKQTRAPGSEPYICKTCSKTFVKQFQLDAHEQFCKRYICKDCELVFFNLKELISHRKHHNPPKRKDPDQDREIYQCTDCSKCFPSEVAVDRHIAYVHYPTTLYMCEFCSKSFKDKSYYNIHRKLIHLKQWTPVECKTCGKWLKDTSYLSTHMRLSHTTRNWPCNRCGKDFLTHVNLQSHIRASHKERNFPCNVCGKCFFVKSSLKEHLTSHTGGYLYTCSHCPKRFNSYANMISHKKKMHFLEWKKEREQYRNRYNPTHIAEGAEKVEYQECLELEAKTPEAGKTLL
ncbi:zinc finger protein 70-like [Anopheles bellator]|uniref:zinc finger protein 70-like n=1 Tax=Anopheles bellator TaxID=139047 RepID=UPI0026487863|nr:zinc finger protein 70-like [Anopheles bellator]